MIPAMIAAGTAAYGAYQANSAKKLSEQAMKMREEARRAIEAVYTPNVDSMKVNLDKLIQQGIITPEEAQASLVEHNAYDDINVDPRLRGAQMEALQGLQDVYHGGGMTAIDKSRLQQIQDEQSTFEKGQREAILDNSRRRGTSGSGMEIAAQLISQQEGANRAGRAGLDVAAEAQKRALEAMTNAGQLGGQIEDRSYGEDAKKAAAANAIAEFNASNTQQVNMANTNAKNAAKAMNLSESQRIADTNTTNENTNRTRNADLLQRDYENRMNKATNVANAMNGQASSMDTRYGQDQAFNGGLISLGGQLYSASQNNSNDKLKTNTSSPWYAAKGGRVPEKDCYADGGKIPGEAEFPGDDFRNDKVDAKLSPGELVVPRSQADDVEEFMGSLPRTENKPSVEAVKTILQALTEMGL